ncbi:MAG: RagB/SusD family nutrient uptake outer membrane protein [Lewinellaceae bacterium]|nr:RagB/SusD family nutrient uptake outer membrane protein [Lewinellaceae bacterium]
MYRIRKSIFIIGLALGAVSCDNNAFFELTNPPEFPWLNMNELERGVVSPYNFAFTTSWSNFFGDDRLIFECMSDEVYLLPNTSADIPFEEMYGRTTEVEMSKANSGFSLGYKCITHANSVLDFLKENDYRPYPNPTKADLENLARIQGEMLFMRAYAYFYLAVRHAPAPGAPNFTTEEILPLRLETPLSAEAANKANYVTTEIIYDQVVADLLKAKELLPEAFVSGLHHPSYVQGRATRYAAAGMLARVYFRIGRWDEAMDELDYVISGPFDLSEDPIEAFNKDYAEDGREVIWATNNHDPEIVRANKVPTSMNWSDYRAVNGGRGAYQKRCTWNQFPLSHSVLKQIGWMDDNLEVTEEALRDKRYQQLFWRIEGNPGNNNADPTQYEMQYPHIKDPHVWGDKYYRATDGQRSNIPIIRLAEMYLTRAILRYRAGNVAGAAEDLNMVRIRAGLEPLATASEQDIHNERIREMAFEGDRLLYLQGLQMPIPPGDREAPAINYPYEGLYWKLPQSELDFKED